MIFGRFRDRHGSPERGRQGLGEGRRVAHKPGFLIVLDGLILHRLDLRQRAARRGSPSAARAERLLLGSLLLRGPKTPPPRPRYCDSNPPTERPSGWP